MRAYYITFLNTISRLYEIGHSSALRTHNHLLNVRKRILRQTLILDYRFGWQGTLLLLHRSSLAALQAIQCSYGSKS